MKTKAARRKKSLELVSREPYLVHINLIILQETSLKQDKRSLSCLEKFSAISDDTDRSLKRNVRKNVFGFF